MQHFSPEKELCLAGANVCYWPVSDPPLSLGVPSRLQFQSGRLSL